MFGKTGIELLQEVAQCPADSLPAFNVSLKLAAAARPPPAARCATAQAAATACLQEEAFRNVIDEVHLQHERLTSVYK